MKENNKQISRPNIIKMLIYAAAALSTVSFLTTLNGIDGIVTDSIWLAGLISFGVQAIILVMGLWFIPAVKTIWEQNIKLLLKRIVLFFMIILYLCATLFSSFFSYVYMSNAAYTDVRPTDYNMELELFLVENTRTLRNYNDAIYDLLLKNIRQTAPTFRTLWESYRQKANDEIRQITSKISKYETAVIPDQMKFSKNEAITAYEGPNMTTANMKLQDDCERLERDINQYITYYNNDYYPMYEQYYNALVSQTDTVSADSRKTEIDNLINNMNDQIVLLNGYGHIYDSITSYIKSKCNGIISQYNSLLRELNTLKNGYDEIQKHPDVIQGEGLTLQNFYNSVYSTDILTQEELEEARDNLQQIVSVYIQNSDEINEENVSALVECIEWLDKLNQCKEVRDKVEQFETNNLAKTYVIISGDPENMGASNIPATTEIEQVDVSAWNTARRTDVTEFISIVKSLPDINQVLQQAVIDDDDSAIASLRKMEQENYISCTLMEAYKYSRAKLENISDLEKAWDYLYSENNFLAIFCCLIAVFLDIAACLIGIYMYTCQDNANKKTNKEGLSTKDPQKE